MSIFQPPFSICLDPLFLQLSSPFSLPLSCFPLLIMLLTFSFPFPMFFPTYICQAKVMSQLIYHPAIFWSTSGNHQQPSSTRPTSPTFPTSVETTTEFFGHKTSCDSCWEAEGTRLEMPILCRPFFFPPNLPWSSGETSKHHTCWSHHTRTRKTHEGVGFFYPQVNHFGIIWHCRSH